MLNILRSIPWAFRITLRFTDRVTNRPLQPTPQIREKFLIRERWEYSHFYASRAQGQESGRFPPGTSVFSSVKTLN